MKFAKLFCASLVFVGCYQTKSLRLDVRSPATVLNCVDMADQAFFAAGYMKLTGSMGAMVYSPRGPAIPSAQLPFQWGIALSLPARPPVDGAPCDYTLQAVSADPSCEAQCAPMPAPGIPYEQARNDLGRRQSNCSLQCQLTPQPGAEYDQATRDMGDRLRAAFVAPVDTAQK